MSLPTTGSVHVNRPLTNMSVLYAQSLTRFAADRVFPIITSDKESNLFFKFDKRYWARDTMKQRAIGAMAAEGGFGVTTDSYFCETYALRKPVPDRLRRNSDQPINQDRAAMRFLTQMERIRREKQFVTDFVKTGVWSTDKTGVAAAPGANQFLQWDNPASTPIENVRAFRTGVDLLTLGAARPNVFACGKQVWDVLADHPDIIDRLKYGGQLNGNLAQVTPAMIASLFELDEVIVCDAVEETSLEGQATSGAYMWGKKALLLYRNPAKGLTVEDVSGGYTLCWQDEGANSQGWRIKQYREEGVESDIFEIQSQFAQKGVALDGGAALVSIVA